MVSGIKTKNEILTLMNKNWIYEAIVTTTDTDGTPRAAPIGISAHGSEQIILETYKTSRTSKNMIRSKKFIINFVMYVELFWNSVIHEHLEFDESGQLKDADARLDARLEKIEDMGNKIRVYSKISDYQIKNSNFILINRAKHLTLESIIKFTKPDTSEARDEIYENLRVIKKVAPDSKYERIVKEILKKVENKN